MEKDAISKTFLLLHDKMMTARIFKESVEPETHEHGYHKGMESAYELMMEEVEIYDMVENDGMTKEEAEGWLAKINNI